MLAGKSVSLLGPADVIHSWSFIGDVCTTMATVGTDDRSLGRAWHVPTLPAVTARTMINAISDEAGLPHVKIRQIPAIALRLGGLFSPVIRELLEVRYQFSEPFVIESSDTTEVFGLEPTPMDEQVRETLRHYQSLAAAQ